MKNFTFLNLAFLITTFLFFNSPLEAQSIEWAKNFGSSDQDQARTILQTTDNGFLAIGYTESDDIDVSESNGGSDVWIVKTDQNGELLWEKNYGGSARDAGNFGVQTVDGGFVIIGTTTSDDGDVSENHGLSDIWVIKLDSEGELEWEKNLGGSKAENTNHIRQTLDGGYIICGETSSEDGDVSGIKGAHDIWVVKLNSIGEIEWENTLGGAYADSARSIEETSDGGYIIGGSSNSLDGDISNNLGESDIWIVKLFSDGEIEWEKSLGGSGSDSARSAQQLADGGYIVLGNTNSTDGDVSGNIGGYEGWIIKLNADGEIEWEKILENSDLDMANEIQLTNDGGFVIAGSIEINDSGDFWVVKLNSNGALEWKKNLGGSGNDRAHSIQQANDGGYIMTGYAFSTDGDIQNNKGESDFWVVKLSALIDNVNSIDANSQILIYPNPSNGDFQIFIEKEMSELEYQIYDLLGRPLYQGEITQQQIQFFGMPKGAYWLQVNQEEQILWHKIIIH